MKTAIRYDLAAVSVCRRIARIRGQKPAGGAERAERREGKIKQSGTMSGRFGKFLLSAHWLGSLRAALYEWSSRAVSWRNTLALLGCERHCCAKPRVSAPSRFGRRS